MTGHKEQTSTKEAPTNGITFALIDEVVEGATIFLSPPHIFAYISRGGGEVQTTGLEAKQTLTKHR